MAYFFVLSEFSSSFTTFSHFWEGKMKNCISILTVIVASLLLVATNGNTAYIGGGTGNDQEKWIMDSIDFADGVEAASDFYFDSQGKFDDLDKWDGSALTIDGVTITGVVDSEGEITGGTFSIDPGSDIEFISFKAGDGFVMMSIDELSGIWDTALLGGKGISHVTLWTGEGSITFPPDEPGGGAQVPEPATIFLVGSGLLGLLGYRKKFWKSKT